jgi:hypothetical protein
MKNIELLLECTSEELVCEIVEKLWLEHFDSVFQVLDLGRLDKIGEILLELDDYYCNEQNLKRYMQDQLSPSKIVYFDPREREKAKEEKRARRLLEDSASEFSSQIIEVGPDSIIIEPNPLQEHYPAHKALRWQCVAQCKGQERREQFKTVKEAREWGQVQRFQISKEELDAELQKFEKLWN